MLTNFSRVSRYALQFGVFICIAYVFVELKSNGRIESGEMQVWKDKPLVFIGGHPRSGTTLLRVLLDVHQDIRCGAETLILSRVLKVYRDLDNPSMRRRLQAGRVYPFAMNEALRAYIYTLLENAGPPARILCNKDPLSLNNIPYIREVFPQAKFIHMIRDGRAVVSSMLRRKVTVGNHATDEMNIFTQWEKIVTNMTRTCQAVGSACLQVRYESLALRPNRTMHRILKFLDVPWDPIVLNHETIVRSQTILSKLEPSTSQVVHPINTQSLAFWASSKSLLSDHFIHNIHKSSTVLRELGYASLSIPPVYGIPEDDVVSKTQQLLNDEEFRKVFD